MSTEAWESLYHVTDHQGFEPRSIIIKGCLEATLLTVEWVDATPHPHNLMYTRLNKNQAAWNFVRPAPEVTLHTEPSWIRVVVLSPYLFIRDVSLSSVHYNQSVVVLSPYLFIRDVSLSSVRYNQSVVVLSPYLFIRDVSVYSVHYNQSRRVYINQRHNTFASSEVKTWIKLH